MFQTYDTPEGSNHAQLRPVGLLSCDDNLMALSWHMPVSRSPFRYAVAVREENYTYELLQKKHNFTINFLSYTYRNEIDMLGRLHGNEEDKLLRSGLQVETKDPHGNLILSASDFVYQCEVCDTYQNGDHTIFIADVKQIHVNETQSNAPVFFYGCGRYATVGNTIQVNKGDN